jgi:Icc-related predicted phosphoesterase
VGHEEQEEMKIQVLSDLHFEFHRDWGNAFLFHNDPSDVDVLVLAGDISLVDYGLIDTLKTFADQYPDVIYVTGNHEYYNSSPAIVHNRLEALDREVDNLHWLNHENVDIDGQIFSGTALWFREHPENVLYERMLSDFLAISSFDPWVYDENDVAETFLNLNVERDTIVVTHHLPAEESVATRFKGTVLNRFFLCDMSDLIWDQQPKLWIHGHTHGNCDYLLGETRVVANPMGYPHALNRDFQKRFIIEV